MTVLPAAKLVQSSHLFFQLKVLLSLGGTTLGETVALLLAKIGTNGLWSLYNIYGRRGGKNGLFDLLQLKHLFMGKFQ